MDDQYAFPYLDSSVWLGWINGEVINGVDRGRIGTHILRHATNEVYHVCISALTLAEVHKTAGHEALQGSKDAELLQYLRGGHIQIVDVDRLIGEEANRFCREFGLKPCDAVHLACALRARCDYLLTWDDKLAKVMHPGIKIAVPEARGQHFLGV